VSARCYQAGSRQMLLQGLVAVVAAGATYAWSMSITPPPVLRELNSSEAMLVRALLDIRDSKFTSAFDHINNILAVNPNFRLAQLVKGDLLLARTRAINSIGNPWGGSVEQVAGLRDEARARLVRSQFERSADLVPRYLVQLPQTEKFALVLDSTKSTLFVFENTGTGTSYVADYYVSIGKNGLEKLREGDKKTPVGVYNVVSQLPKERLSDFYGTGAYPLSYPNEWDRIRGRDGHGIWLHGTPRDTYSRPPRASDGCIVLNNEDLETLSAKLQIGSTPIIIADSIEWVKPDEIATLRADLALAIENWRHDWESRNTDSYLSHYSKQFNSSGLNFSQWAAQKRQINAAKDWIKVEITDMSLLLYPGNQQMAVATFAQDYASSNLSNRMLKRQYWIREDNTWRILLEGAG
jgi:murein L,D-transpeptidase YafK